MSASPKKKTMETILQENYNEKQVKCLLKIQVGGSILPSHILEVASQRFNFL